MTSKDRNTNARPALKCPHCGQREWASCMRPGDLRRTVDGDLNPCGHILREVKP